MKCQLMKADSPASDSVPECRRLPAIACQLSAVIHFSADRLASPAEAFGPPSLRAKATRQTFDYQTNVDPTSSLCLSSGREPGPPLKTLKDPRTERSDILHRAKPAP